MKSKHAGAYLQLGLKIAYYRKLRGLTQEQLAEQVGLPPAFIGRAEAPNLQKAISLDTLFDIAEALEVPPLPDYPAGESFSVVALIQLYFTSCVGNESLFGNSPHPDVSERFDLFPLFSRR